MPKSKLATPEWIIQGYDSEADYNKAKGLGSKKKTGHCFLKDDLQKKETSVSPKALNSGGKTFKVRKCPKCDSDDVGVVVGKEKTNMWECKKCGWKGKEIEKQELTEEEFMKYLDEKGEEVS